MTVRDDILAVPNESLRSGKVAADYLVHMDFVDSPKRWWTGWGDVEIDGQIWQGIGDLISVPSLPATLSDAAPSVTFTLQGATTEMIALSRAARTRVKGQSVTVYQQFFETDYWTPLMPAFVVYKGKMDVLSFLSVRGDDGNLINTISVSAHGLFTNRNDAKSTRWSDVDQKALYGTSDTGCERMSIYTQYSPVF